MKWTNVANVAKGLDGCHGCGNTDVFFKSVLTRLSLLTVPKICRQAPDREFFSLSFIIAHYGILFYDKVKIFTSVFTAVSLFNHESNTTQLSLSLLKKNNTVPLCSVLIKLKIVLNIRACVKLFTLATKHASGSDS